MEAEEKRYGVQRKKEKYQRKTNIWRYTLTILLFKLDVTVLPPRKISSMKYCHY